MRWSWLHVIPEKTELLCDWVRSGICLLFFIYSFHAVLAFDILLCFQAVDFDSACLSVSARRVWWVSESVIVLFLQECLHLFVQGMFLPFHIVALAHGESANFLQVSMGLKRYRAEVEILVEDVIAAWSVLQAIINKHEANDLSSVFGVQLNIEAIMLQNDTFLVFNVCLVVFTLRIFRFCWTFLTEFFHESARMFLKMVLPLQLDDRWQHI